MARNTAALAGADTLRSTTAAKPGGTNAPVEADYSATSDVIAKTNGGVSRQTTAVLHTSVGILAVAVILLWLMGGIVFRSAIL